MFPFGNIAFNKKQVGWFALFVTKYFRIDLDKKPGTIHFNRQIFRNAMVTAFQKFLYPHSGFFMVTFIDKFEDVSAKNFLGFVVTIHFTCNI